MDPPAGVSFAGSDSRLLEREQPLNRLCELTAAALEGRGSVVAVVGGAGEGKTALLAEAGTLAEEMGAQVWRAYGSTLERPFAFGVVRQLLGPPAAELGPDQRDEVFTGAARLAASVLDIEDRSEPLDQFTARHGLYWLLVNLTRRSSAVLLVDDAHWADQPSLEWLGSLLRRLDGLPVLVVVASRPPAFDTAGDSLAAMLSDPSIPLLRVGPLSQVAAATLVRRELRTDVDEPFVDACHRATGGNPLALVELVRTLRRDVLSPGLATDRLGDRAPETIERHVRGRLDELGPEAVELARALAVLGDRTLLRQVSSLAGVELERAMPLVDELTLAGIVARATELRFEHPLVHAAVRDGMSPRHRARLHARAAALLAEERGDPEAIAAHLLSAEPAGNPDSVGALREAGIAALRRGSPESARAYLERALIEPPPPELQSAVRGELGRALFAALDTAALEHLAVARTLTTDPRERAGLGLMLAEACFYAGQRDKLFAVLGDTLCDLGDADPGLAFAARAMQTAARAGLDHSWPATEHAEHERLVALAGPASETGRKLRLSLALVISAAGRRTASETVAIVEDAFEDGMLERTDPGSSTAAGHGLFALVYADALDRAIELAGRMMTHGGASGNALMIGISSHAHGVAHLRRGALADAEASARTSVETATRSEARFAESITRPVLAETLIERGRLVDAVEVLAPVPAEVEAPAARHYVHLARARLHRARGAREEAITELEKLGEEASHASLRNPTFLPWRSELALLIAGEDPDRSRELADSELADAIRVKLPRAIGVALRARAASEHGDVREATLRESVAALEQSPARLELTRALIDLGAHLRRAGRRSAAREPLRQALELAHRCAAEPLIALAGAELQAADGRPRSPWLTGAGALTPSELRVARLAAQGATNQQIAETLFVTIKTVEMHLSHVYRKLDTRSRTELPRLLGDEDGLE
ncbi:MAG TPA: AAA family ATPase [Solirubrobacteraceae bacterium]|nr:AAA family ATPase [Solirubrobacteraceae bacterium]